LETEGYFRFLADVLPKIFFFLFFRAASLSSAAASVIVSLLTPTPPRNMIAAVFSSSAVFLENGQKSLVTMVHHLVESDIVNTKK
jgi:hypothetical protein